MTFFWQFFWIQIYYLSDKLFMVKWYFGLYIPVSYQYFSKTGYRRLAKQPHTRFMAVSWEKSTRTRIAYTHFAIRTIFSCDCLRTDFIHFLTRKSLCVLQSYPFYCETTRNMRNLFREVTWKNTRNFYTHFVSHVLSCYKCVSWPSRKLSVASLKPLLFYSDEYF